MKIDTRYFEQRTALAGKIRDLSRQFENQGKRWRGDQEREFDEASDAFDELNVQEARIMRTASAESFASGPKNASYFSNRGGLGNSGDLARQVNAAANCWFKASGGRRFSDTEGQALSNLGYHPGANTITLPLGSHPPMFGAELTRHISNAMQGESGPAGGYLVGSGFLGSLVSAERDFSPIIRVATIERTETGEPMLIPVIDDDSNTGALLGADAVGEQDITVNSRTMNAYTFTSKMIRVRNELLMDATIDLGSYIGSRLGRRIGQAFNSYATTGSGGSQPYGLVTQSELGVTTAGATSITADSVIDLIGSVDESYRMQPGVALMMADETLTHIQKLKDGSGRYLLDNFSVGATPRIRGYDVVVNRNMPTIASGAKTILFGQLSAYMVRQAGSVTLMTLRERYADFNQTAFLAFERMDGMLIDPGIGLVKHLVMA